MTSSTRTAFALIGSAAILAAAACSNNSKPSPDTNPTMTRDTYTSQTVTVSPTVTDTLAPGGAPGDTGVPGNPTTGGPTTGGPTTGGPSGSMAPGAGSGSIPGGPSGAYGPGGATGTIPGVGGGTVTPP